MNTPKTTINLVIFLNLVILQASSGLQDVKSSVYGGKPAGFFHIHKGVKTLWNDGQFPYSVQIAIHDHHLCGGALLKKDTVLTAAHCFTKIPICDVRIWAGSYNRLDKKSVNTQIRKIHDVVIHHMFNWDLIPPRPNDIALVFVMKPFELTLFVQPVTMATKIQRDQFMDTTVVLMGYGKMENNELSNKLLVGDVILLQKRECVDSLNNPQFINVLCVKCHKDMCSISGGDSGSPLVKIDKHGKHILLGIASYSFQQWNSEAAATNKPAVYTDVAEYQEWLQTVEKSKKPKTNRFLNWCKNH